MSTTVDIFVAAGLPYAIMSTNEDIDMKHTIQSTEDLGLVIRAVRKSTLVRQDDLAAMVGVSRQFTVDVEKPTVQMARVLRLLKELGVELSVDIPAAASQELERLARRRAASKDAAP
jgi:DNA-binding XRE family transcriptional regulator